MNETEIDLNLVQNGKKAAKIPYEVNRSVMSQSDLDDCTGFERQKATLLQSMRSSLRAFSFKAAVLGLVPLLDWLPKYKPREYLAGDIIAGVTLSVLAIPQGMAYGLLAGLDPVNGLYLMFFPVLIYFVLGSSRHASVGTFAVVSIMTSKIVETYADPNYGTPDALEEKSFSRFQVATAATLACGVYQLAMFVLRLGIVASLMSDALVSGFTTASAIHVIVAQMKDLLGISYPRHKGAFKIILSARDIALQLPHVNLHTLAVSASCMLFLIVCNELLRPMLAKRTKIPLPSELVAVIVYTAASFFLDLSANYGIEVVGEIPTGLPSPQFPPLELVYTVALDSIAVCVVSYSIVVSMGLICAKKDKSYEVNPNQELLAMGASNVFGSCFQCIPMACALSRTMVSLQIGGKTQVVSIVSGSIILMLLLWIGPLFETLPRCILASIIIVSLKSMLWQFGDVRGYYRESKLDALVWIGTFLTVVVIDIDIGLLVGIVLSLLSLYVKGLRSYACMLGQVAGTDIYVDLKGHRAAVKEVPAVRIFRHYGSINFATSSSFKRSLCANLGVDCHVLKRAAQCSPSEARELSGGMRALIVDLGAVAHLDVRGYRTLVDVKRELKTLDVRVLLAEASDVVYDSIRRAVQLGDDAIDIFPTVHDAVLFVARKDE